MEREISGVATLGVVMLALAAIIGIGFSIFTIARNTASDGMAGVEESLDRVAKMTFNTFDQRQINGSAVLAGYESLKGKTYAFLVATQAVKDVSPAVGTAPSANNLASGAGGSASMNIVGAYKDSTFGALIGVRKSTDTGSTLSAGLRFINYNALLALAPGGGTSAGRVYFHENGYVATDGFLTDASRVQFNSSISNMSKSGMMEYIPSTAMFQAYLIRDTSSSIMGVAVEQIQTNT